jgi:predicted membrane protein
MRGRNIAGIIIIIVGLSILFSFPFFNILLAIFLVWVGIKIMRKGWKFSDYEESSKVNEDELDKTFIFSPVNKIIVSDNFTGGNITCIFAGGQIDFSGVKTSKHEVDLEITNIFAGLKIILPKGWKVNSQETSILGGVDDKTKGEGKVTVNLKGSSIFGGMEFVN